MAITRYCFQDFLPPTSIVAVQFADVVLSILFKAATAKGMSCYVFVSYTCTLATLFLFPIAFFLNIRKTGLPFPLVSRIFLLAFIALLAQLCSYKGLKLGTPTLASVINNLVPALIFILAFFFRMEKVELKRSSSRAKIIGTIASICGAFVVIYYKGPKVFYTSNWSSSSAMLLEQPLGSSQSNWVASGLLLFVSCLLTSLWYIIQFQIMKMYPEVIIVSHINNLFLVNLSVPAVCILEESNKSSWRLTPNIAVASFQYTGIFAISFAAVMSAIFLGDDLYIGSIIGALILSSGLYAVLWGTTKEEEMTDTDDIPGLSSCEVLFSDSMVVPLL